jgi:hypothetical protein
MKKSYRICYLNKDGEHTYRVKANEVTLDQALNKILEYNRADISLKFISISAIEQRGRNTEWEGFL